MSKYFTSDGYLKADPLFLAPQPFVFVVGGRATGKTYGALDWLSDNCTCDSKFIHMRRTSTELEMMELENPYEPYGREVELVKVKKVAQVLRGGEDIGYHFAMHSISNIRGINMSKVDYVYLDEFIPEPGAYKRKNEGIIMFNAYETINRNRELMGMPPVKLVCTANLNDRYSDILKSFGYTDELDKIGDAKPLAVHSTPDKLLILINDSIISTRKKATALYRVSANEEFNAMALDNTRVDEIMPLKDYGRTAYTWLATLGEININQLHHGGYYITRAAKPGSASKADLRRWCKVYASYTRGKLIASSNYVAMTFINMYNH